jgi:hypothetical protein
MSEISTATALTKLPSEARSVSDMMALPKDFQNIFFVPYPTSIHAAQSGHTETP